MHARGEDLQTVQHHGLIRPEGVGEPNYQTLRFGLKSSLFYWSCSPDLSHQQPVYGNLDPIASPCVCIARCPGFTN